MARILLVDDDVQVRDALRLLLGHAGHDVDVAQDGNEALKQLGVREPDLLITDVVMPEKDGLELVMELRQTQPHLKVLAISGGGRLNSSSYLVLAKKLGADAVLVKPVEGRTLLQTVAALLDGKSG